MTPEEIAEQVFDAWYADAAAMAGPTARRTCIAAIAAAIRDAVEAERKAAPLDKDDLLSHMLAAKARVTRWK